MKRLIAIAMLAALPACASMQIDEDTVFLKGVGWVSFDTYCGVMASRSGHPETYICTYPQAPRMPGRYRAFQAFRD